MGVVAWLRASQAVLFEASVLPAVVGAAAAVDGGSPFSPFVFVLILVSLLGIQAGANLFKGFWEAQDRTVPPASAGSWLAFDSGAAVGLTRDPRAVCRAGWACMFVGIVAGLTVVALTQNLLLLMFGAAGFALAWSYSSPPLKLSYRGVGEVSTFLAFGPIMTVGATVAYGLRGVPSSAVASLVLGLSAAAVSFSRYFPNGEEDRAKGKRTPITILGPIGAMAAFLGIVFAAVMVLLVWPAVDDRFVLGWAALPFLLAAISFLPRAVRGRMRYETVIGLTVAAHVAAGVGLAAAFLI